MKTILLFLFASCGTLLLSAQTHTLTIYPDPTTEAQEPNQEAIYYIYPWSANCYFLDTVVNGKIVTQQISGNRLKLTIIWQGSLVATWGRIEVVQIDSSCFNIGPGQDWVVSIIPFSNLVPIVTGPIEYYMGEYVNLSFQASIDSSIADYKVAVFEWQAPPEWNFAAYGFQRSNAAISFNSDNVLTEGCLKVRARTPNGNWSDWKEYCLHGTIRSPCPVQLVKGFLLCDDTTTQFVYASEVHLRQVPQYNWTPTHYTWEVPPSWHIAGTNPTTRTSTSFQTDGHTDGVIKVFATAGDFTSAICEFPTKFLVADPATAITGPDFVCQAGHFHLSHQPSPQSYVTWEVVALDPTLPPVVFPDHGSGVASFQVIDTTVSGYFQINYTIGNTCGSISLTKSFFIGKPRLSNATLDGATYTAQSLCVGNHGAAAQVLGAEDKHIDWSASAGISGYAQRDSFIFSLAPTGLGNCPIVTASATNSCGTTLLPLEVCPQGVCDTLPLDLLVYPNPAFLVVSLEIVANDPVRADYTTIDKVEIFNQLGQLVTIWHEPHNKLIIHSIVDLPNGLYTLRVSVQGQIILKQLAITRVF